MPHFIFSWPHLPLVLATVAVSSSVWALISFIHCATWRSCFTLAPVAFHPRLLWWHRGQHPTTHLVFMHAQPQRAGVLTNYREKLGPMVAGSQWVNASSFLSLDRRFYYHISNSFSGFPWNPATNHHRGILLHYPLSLRWLRLLSCFTPPGPRPCTWAPTHQ